MAYGPRMKMPTPAWRVRCERGRTRWVETYYSATAESARKMIEFTYPGVTVHEITRKQEA